MRTFSALTINRRYRIPHDDIVESLLNPLLSCSKVYKRSVGFFSSSSLVHLTEGLAEFCDKQGQMRLIISPKLSDEDIEAIHKGYQERSEIVGDYFSNELGEVTDYFEAERLNILAHLISSNRLDIKIAIPKADNDYSMYHEKLAIFIDDFENKVAFEGSMNDSYNGYYKNIENIKVYSSIRNEDADIIDLESIFDTLWTNQDPHVNVFDFPDKGLKVIESYKKEDIDKDIDIKEKLKFEKTENTFGKEEALVLGPKTPSFIELYPYQEDAISAWKKNKYRGILDMATGTGKTITALSGMIKLYNEKRGEIGIVICVPYQHLVEQWAEDIELYNFNPIIAYSNSFQKNWREMLESSIYNYKNKLSNHFLLITTNATFSSSFVQNLLKTVDRELLLVVDEAHNFGAPTYLNTLDDKYTYRLALSATFDRHMDKEGTDRLYDYFEKKVYEYPLEKAIEEGYLTNYYYYPIPVYLTDEELDLYNEITEKLKRYYIKDKKGNIKYSDSAKGLLIKRARIIGGAKNKIKALKREIAPYKDENHTIVYCGATTLKDFEGISGDFKEEKRQIDVVQEMLYREHNMLTSKFTADESSSTRQELIQDFESGSIVQALVAIRCLDEGVDIPNIKRAFILASSTNPKEYIQRRGRVLRRHEGKEYAEIFDFITLPRDLNEVRVESDLQNDLPLIKRELIRLEDFATLSLNKRDSEDLIMQIKNSYSFEIDKEDYQ